MDEVGEKCGGDDDVCDVVAGDNDMILLIAVFELVQKDGVLEDDFMSVGEFMIHYHVCKFHGDER